VCDGGGVDTAQVWSPNWRTARKPHACYACGEPIDPGDRYHHVSYVYDGSWGQYHHCARCWTLYQAICDAHDKLPGDPFSDAWQYVDLALDCGTRWEDELGELPDDVAALAFALPQDFAEAGRG